MVGRWVRPWRGETLCGVVVGVSGEYLICRAPGGFQFAVLVKDVEYGKADVFDEQPTAKRLLPRKQRTIRLTEKGMA